MTDWLQENSLNPNFEALQTPELADMLRKLYGTVLTKKGTPNSKSEMINLRAGINRYHQNPPFNCTFDIMNDPDFLPANKVFSGRMRDNKEKGFDVSKPRESIDQQDLNKLFNEYFKPAVETMNTQLLLHKVFFDIVYYTGRRAKEGLRELSKSSFDIKVGSDGLEYIEINFNEKTKKNQGSDNSTSKRALHDNHHIISAMPGNKLCPVESFKCYLALLNHEENAFFQYPNKKFDGFNKAAIGKNSLGTMMKDISKAAKLSKEYTNHCIRKTTATALKRQGFDLNEISHVTKHKNLDSLKHYIGGPSYTDKRRYNDAMANYASNDTNPLPQPPPKKTTSETFKNDTATPKSPQINTGVLPQCADVAPVIKNVPNVTKNNCIVPMFNDSEESACTTVSNEDDIAQFKTQNQQNVVNQMRQASHLFQNANFTNCNFTFQMPK